MQYIVPDLARSSLISVKKFCDTGCRIEFDTTNFYVNFNNKIISQWPIDEKTKLWTLLLGTNPTPTPSNDNKMLKFSINRIPKCMTSFEYTNNWRSQNC